MIYNFILNALLGGATGYITDKYAINTLFNNYSPIKKYSYGNTLPISKKEFVKRLSLLMERDVISGKKIANALVTGDLEQEFKNFSKDLFEECLCREIRNLRIKDTELYGEISDSSYEVLSKLLESNIDSISEGLLKNVKITDILSTEQIEYISEKILDYVADTIRNTRYVNDMLSQMHDDFGEVKLGNFISKDMTDVLRTNAENVSKKLGNVLKDNFDSKLDDYLNRIIDNCNINSELRNVEDKLLSMQIKDVFRVPKESIKVAVTNSIIAFIESEKGIKAIKNVYFQIVDYLSGQGYTMYSLYSKNYQSSIRNYMKDKANTVAHAVLQWVDSNNDDLNETIRSTIDEVITGNEQLKDKLYNTILDYYRGKKYTDNSIAKKLFLYASEGNEISEITDFIISTIDNSLRSIKVRDIVLKLEEKKVLGANILYDSILKYVKLGGSDDEIEKMLDHISEKPVSTIISIDLVKIYNDRLKYILIDYLKEKIVYSQETHGKIVNYICDTLEDKLNNNLGEVVSKVFLSDNSKRISGLVADDIVSNKEVLKDNFSKIIKESIEGENIDFLVDKLSENKTALTSRMNNRVVSQFNMMFKEYTDNIGEMRISKMLTKVSSLPNVYDSLKDFIKAIAGESIHAITDGQIREFVVQVFEYMSDDQFNSFIKDILYYNNVKTMAEGAVIGGVMGIAGTVLSNTVSWNGIVGPGIPMYDIAVCSAIGVVTNVVAQNRFFNISVPQNIMKKIPMYKDKAEEKLKKKQDCFAGYMGEIVREKLIDSDSIQELSEKKQDEIKKKIFSVISINNYEKIYKIVSENGNYIARKITNLCIKKVQDNKKAISKYAVGELKNIPVKQFINRNMIDTIVDFSNDKQDEIMDFIYKYIGKKLLSQTPLSLAFPKSIVNGMNNSTISAVDNLFEEFTGKINDKLELLKHIRKYSSTYNEMVDKPIIDALSRNTIDNIEEIIFSVGYPILFNEKRVERTAKRIYRLIADNFIFSNKLGDIINRRDLFLINSMYYKYFKDIVVNYHSYLTSKEEDIANDIRTKILSNMNLREKSSYANVGGDKVIDRIIHRLISEKIPIFLDKHFDKFYEISKTITNELFDINIENIGINLDFNNIEDIVNGMFDDNNTSSVINNKCYLLYVDYMRTIENKNLKGIINYFKINSVDGIYNTYRDDIIEIIDVFCQKINYNKGEVLNIIKEFTKEAMPTILLDVKLADLFRGFNKEKLGKLKDQINGGLKEKDFISLASSGIATHVYNYLDNMDLVQGLVNIQELSDNIEKGIDLLSENLGFRECMDEVNLDILDNQLKENIILNIPSEVFNKVFELIVEGFYLTMHKNLKTLFKSIELDQITIKEINELDSSKFRRLFEKPYKKHVPVSLSTGIAGGLLGINKYVGVAVVVVEGIVSGVLSGIKRLKIK